MYALTFHLQIRYIKRVEQPTANRREFKLCLFIYKVQKMTSIPLSEIPRPPIQDEIVEDIEKLLKKLETFKTEHQRLWGHYEEVFYCYTDSDSDLYDLIELLEVFAQIAE